MIPDLQVSVLCEDVRQERDGKFMLIGILDSVCVKRFPLKIPKLCIFNRWCCGTGSFIQRTRIVADDNTTTVITGKDVPIILKSIKDYSVSVEIMIGIILETEGTYWIETTLDGKMKMRYPLTVKKISAPAEC